MENREPTQEEVIRLLEIFSEEKDSDGVDRLAKMALKVINDLQKQLDDEKKLHELAKAFHDEKCAEFDKLLYDYNRLSGENALAEKVKELEEENTTLTNSLAEVPDPFPCKVGSGCESAGSGCYTCPNNRYRQYDQKVLVQKILSEIKSWALLHGKDKTTDSFGERGLLFFEAFGMMLEEFKVRYGVEDDR